MEYRPMYIPTREDITRLQALKNSNDTNYVDIYGYLVTKAIEKLIIKYSFLRKKDIPIMDNLQVVHGLCYVYPEEIHNSEYAMYDASLCQKILTKETDDEIKILNELGMFARSVQFNRTTISTVIDILDEKLKNNPKYRFIYNRSEILDAIFGVNYNEFLNLTYPDKLKLIHIDPIYAIKFNPKSLMPDINYPDARTTNYRLSNLLSEGIREYKKRYDLCESIGYDYYKEDFANPQDEQVKKLIKYLHN